MILLRLTGIIILAFSVIVYNADPDSFRYFLFAPILLIGLLTFFVRKNLPLVLFFLYAALFYAYLTPKFLLDIPIVYYFEYDDISFYNKALLVNIVFWVTLTLVVKPTPASFKFPDFSKWFQPNSKIVWVNVVVMILIMFFGFSGNSVLSGAKYGTEDFGDKSIFTEYYVLFLIFAYVHCGSKLGKWLVITLAGLMVLVCFSYASRISALLIILVVFLLHFSNRFSLGKMLLGVFLGVLIMNSVGSIRQMGGKKTVRKKDPNELVILSSTQSNMFYGSVTLIALVDDGSFDFTTRVKASVGFVVRLFLPSSLSFKEGSLASFGQTYSSWGGGADPNAYFYVWFGWAGPVIFGLILTALLNKLGSSDNSKYFFFMAIILLATFPRWFGYEPGIIFKMTWVGLVILIVQENIFFVIEKKRISE